MDSNNRIAQVYGYAVCLITIIVMLISITGFVNALFNYSDPLHADRSSFGSSFAGPTYPISSFNAYKRAYQERRPRADFRSAPGVSAPSDRPIIQPESPPLSDSALKVMYQEDRSDQIDNVKSHAIRQMVTSVLLLGIAAVLFMVHWRWLRPRAA
jgi:hypothetical protein